MNMLLETLTEVSSHPAAWLCVLAVASVAILSAIHCVMCPFVRGTEGSSDGFVPRYLDKPIIAGPVYFFVMLAGIIAMIAGLAMIADGKAPLIAFFIISAGICVVQIAPLRVRLAEAYDRIMAAQMISPDEVEIARERLRVMHYFNIAMSAGIAAVLAVALLSF
ncbi:MAG: hypothetical protein AAF416_01430 [Pseudomonadota bacterium]